MPGKKYSKVEEEIIQILDRMDNDDSQPRPSHLQLVHSARSTPLRRRFALHGIPKPSPAITLVLVFVLAIVALMTSGLLQIAAMALSLACFVLLVAGRRRMTGGATTIEGSKTWRGRDIPMVPDSGGSIGDRFRDWVRRVRR